MTISPYKFGILTVLIALLLFAGSPPVSAQTPVASPAPELSASATEPAVYRVRSQQIREVEGQLRTRYAKDPGFSVTVKSDDELNVYRICVLASETIQREIPEIIKQYAEILPKDGGKSLIYIEPHPTPPSFQSSQQNSAAPSPIAPPPAQRQTSIANISTNTPIAIPTAAPRPAEQPQEQVHPLTAAALPQLNSGLVQPLPASSAPSASPTPPPPLAFATPQPQYAARQNQNQFQQTPQTFADVRSLENIPLSNVSHSENRGFDGQTAEEESRDSFSLTNVSMAKAEQTLRVLLGTKTVEMSPVKLQVTVVRNNTKRQCTLEIDRDNKRFLLVGNRSFCDQIIRLIDAIDQPEPQQGWERRFIPIANVNSRSIAKIMELSRSPRKLEPKTFEPTRPTLNDPTPRLEFHRNEARQLPPPNKTDKSAPATAVVKHLDPRRNPVVQLVGYQFEGDLGGSGGGGGVEAIGTDVQGQNQSGMEVVSDFRYQILPDLDVLVIDATGAEVARFTDMIRQIEELSKIAEPQFEFYYLKNVNCISLSYVIQQVYRDTSLFTTKQGAVTIIPMINPNAILICGWGKAMETMRDLIETFDKPVAAENSLLQVFRLKHASVTQAMTVLRGAFPTVSALNSAFAQRIQMTPEIRTNAIIVQAGPNDMKDIERIIAEMDVPNAGPKLQVRLFKLKHTMAPDLAQTLTQAITTGTAGTTDRKLPGLELVLNDEKGKRIIVSGIMADVRIAPDIRNNTVIVTAPDQCMDFMAELITLFDSPSATAELKIFPIIYGDANSMIATLRSLIPAQLEGQSGPQLPGSEEEDSLVPIRFAIDNRTNCILAAGAPGDLKIVEALLMSLDRPDQQTRKEYIYELKSMKAEAVAIAINEYIRSKRIIQQQSPGVISPYQQIESEVIIVPEHVSNSLIVSATPRYYDEILKLIQEIDKSPPQVMIQVLIGEVTLNNTDEFGAEFGLQDSLLFNRSTFSNITQGTRKITRTENGVTTLIEEPVITNGSVVPGWMFNDPANSLGNGYNTNSANSAGTVGSQLLTNFATGRVGAESGFGGMVFSANSDAVSIMIRALQETNRIEILSRPQITAMNNQKALMQVGQNVPRFKGTTVGNTTSQANVIDEPVGLMLMVQPSISPEGNIVMLVMVEKSKLSTVDQVTVGVENGREIKSSAIDRIFTSTMISASDNETVVLGGLISKEKQEIHRKVPFLADIPLLGKLFQYEYKKNRRSELLVILTPRIVRDAKDMEKVKQIEAARMSWCLGNVTKLHGDIGVYNVISDEPYAGDATVVYPENVDMETLKSLNDIPLPQQPQAHPSHQPPAPKLAPTLPTPVLPKKN